MGLRIRTNVSALKAKRNLNDTTNRIQDNMAKLSSGYRITKSADDAAGLAISEALRAKMRSMEQATRNAADGISLIQVAEGSMNEINNILIRLRELATQASSDTIGNLERSFTNREYNELVSEIDRISNTTEFNGLNLLGGASKNEVIDEGKMVVHIGTGNGIQPNTDTVEISLEDIKISAEEGLGLFATGGNVGPDSIDNLTFSRSTAAAKLEIIDQAIKKVASNRATLGSKQSRIESAINNLAIQMENVATSKSRIKDVDFASETALFTQNRILGQAGSSVLAQANSTPELALSLLR